MPDFQAGEKSEHCGNEGQDSTDNMTIFGNRRRFASSRKLPREGGFPHRYSLD
jgi:hypothetical protein